MTSLLSLLLLLLLLHHLHPSSAATTHSPPSPLIDSVCKNTTNYPFCVQSLYSDPRAATADPYVLAYISFGLAYLNATHTEDYITHLLKSYTGSKNGSNEESLRKCKSDYGKAVAALEEANNDLDSETFFELGDLAKKAEHDAKDCEGSFKPKHHIKSLSRMNGDFRELCKISFVVSKLFSVSS